MEYSKRVVIGKFIDNHHKRPDLRAKEAQRTRSERVDINTWIRTDASPSFGNYLLLHEPKNGRQRDASASNQHKIAYKYMGATLSEIFANAIRDFCDRSCLGYRAVVTCPVLALNEQGEHVMRDKSFRSDYTWYTYEQIGRRVQDLASGLYYHSIVPGSRALFLASTCLEWFCACQACFQLACQVVVAPEISDNLSMRTIFKEAEIDIIFVSCDQLAKLSSILKQLSSLDPAEYRIHIKQVVIIDWLFSVDFNEPDFGHLRDSASHLVDSILSIGQIEEIGIENPIELNCTEALRDYNSQNYETSRRMSRSIEKEPLAGETLQLPPHDNLDGARSMPLKRRVSQLNCDIERQELRSPSPLTVGYAGERRLSARTQLTPDLSTATGRRRFGSRGSSPRLSVHEIFETDDKTRARAADVAMIVYTPGAVGTLKAHMLTHSYLARSSHYLFLDGMINGDDVHCATLALDNVIEFMTEMCIFSRGGCIGYSCSMETLFYDGKLLFKRDKSDLEALSPTFLMVRPYILESLRTSMQNYLSLKLNPLLTFVMTNILYDYKRFWARRHLLTPIVDRLFFSRLRKLFGLQLKYILCNGATDCSETKDFFAFMLNIPVIELYGPDEALGSMMSVDDIWDYKRRKPKSWSSSRATDPTGDLGELNSSDNEDEKFEDFFKDMQLLPPKVNRNTFRDNKSKNLLSTSSILCPTLGARIRLEDWEDFRTSDLPYPRGRLVVGGDTVCKGYFKRPEAQRKLFYSDSNSISWFRTEHLARVFPNGSFEIISGISDMMRMSDGQFISLSQIEHILRNSQLVDNVCAVCADDRRFVLVLVVPNLRRLAHKSQGEANLKKAIGGMQPEPEELADVEFRREICNDRLLCEFLTNHLNELIQKAGLNAKLNKFLLVPEIWTPETELVTPAYEPKRATIQKFYAADIQSIFRMQFAQQASSSGSRQANRLSARLTSRKLRKLSR